LEPGPRPGGGQAPSEGEGLTQKLVAKY
jgi:hypothetical protein